MMPTPAWPIRLGYSIVPLLAVLCLSLAWNQTLNWLAITSITIVLFLTVMVSVHHAEVIALRLGEPFGTLVLALAITVIEASLIVALMLSGGASAAELARDTVFATVMIICNGVVGICLLVGALRHRTLAFRAEGTTPALAVLATLVTVTLVLPSFTSSTAGPTFSSSQLILAGIVSLVLYATFIFVQTVRHREYFLPIEEDGISAVHPIPSNQTALLSFVWLLISLVAIVGLAKTLAPSIEKAVIAAGVPHATVGIAVALMVLLPETAAAISAARHNRIQTSFNLALGSALATIGLTIPVVAIIVLLFNLPLTLGLANKEIVLLSLTLLISTMTLSRGHATVLHGAVHLVLFVVFIFLTIVP